MKSDTVLGAIGSRVNRVSGYFDMYSISMNSNIPIPTVSARSRFLCANASTNAAARSM